jgi:site-specific DNA recombinase
MKRCAIYARFSTEMQRATSLEDQIRNCRQFAARMGWEILEPHVYQDTAVSGFGVEHRPAYQQLVSAALAAAPAFTVILVDDLSRLSRDLVETLTVYRRLKRNSIELVAVADGIQTTHQMATLQITIKGLVNELYLDDLRDKTHRGLTGRALKGRSTGGRLFGYRTSKGDEGAEWVVFEPEAEIVRRIFRLYADTQSMKAIAVKLNAEGVPFPAKATRRGAMRRGWAVSTIHTIVLNEKYRGRWVWNKTMFVKDPATGKRTPTARPKDDWVVEERPDLALVDGDLWTRVQARLTVVREAYGVTGKQTRPRGQAPEVYSPHLLSGLIRCAVCGARITMRTSQRKKHGVIYRYGRYRCSFHVTKGPAVCSNSMSIRQDVLDAKLLDKFRTALTPDMIEYLVVATNRLLQGLRGTTPQEITSLIGERQVVERELANLVEFVAKGNLSSPRLRDEIRAREERLVELDQRLEQLRATVTPAPVEIDRAWIEERLQSLNELLATDPGGARREIQKHVEELRMAPAPELGDRVVRVTGRAKVDGLLGGEEAVRLQLVAGARNHRNRLTSLSMWTFCDPVSSPRPAKRHQ